jgi:hypothetical protein
MNEIVTCPSCSKQLQIPESFFGKTVQCPECKQTFHAEALAATPASAPDAAAGVSSAPPPPTAPAWSGAPDEERPRRRREEDDEDDRPRRRRLTPHRGGMILAFGIMGLVLGGLGLIFGPIAWIMGNADLREMRAGRMDPSGESTTNTGRILGMVATLLGLIGLVIGCVFGGLFILGIVAGGAAHHHRPRHH